MCHSISLTQMKEEDEEAEAEAALLTDVARCQLETRFSMTQTQFSKSETHKQTHTYQTSLGPNSSPQNWLTCVQWKKREDKGKGKGSMKICKSHRHANHIHTSKTQTVKSWLCIPPRADPGESERCWHAAFHKGTDTQWEHTHYGSAPSLCNIFSTDMGTAHSPSLGWALLSWSGHES